MKICEKCGKEHDGSFGSGRFCSRKCANSHPMTDNRRQHISIGLHRDIVCSCKFCGDEFNNLSKKGQHERHCSLNPNRETTNHGAIKNHNDKLNRNVKVTNYEIKESAELDITYKELEDYRKHQLCCEICGRSIDELNLTSTIKYKNLTIDHNHKNNTFRGLLCNHCNRSLG